MNSSIPDSAGVVRSLVTAALGDPAAALDRSQGDLDLTLRLLRRARLLGRFAWQLRAAGLLDLQPPVVRDQLQSSLVNADARARVALWELNRIAWALAEVPDVPLVALKGCAYLLAGLPNAAGRVFADVDLLVPAQRLRNLETSLSERGWRPSEVTTYDERYYRQWAHELPPLAHVEREVEVDLHHTILMRTARLKPSPSLLLAGARPIPGSRFGVLAPVDMVLHAMTHLLYGGEMDDALRELVDIDDLLGHFGAHEPGFWEQFWSRAVRLDLTRPAFYGLRYAHQLLGTPVPQAVLEASRVAAPPAPALPLMDRLVPLALFPPHPDAPSSRIKPARFLLYLRSHWVRMPPLMLARHLGYKAYVRVVRRPAGKRPSG